MPRARRGRSLPARASVLCALVLGLAWPVVSRADTNDFEVTHFTADDTLDPSIPGGGLRVVEHIEVDFHDQNHGILRVLPDTYRGRALHVNVEDVSSDTGAAKAWELNDQGVETVVKIGRSDTTVTGHQEYTITYTERNVIGFYPDHDELYWNINGAAWRQPFRSITATLHAPSGVPILKTRCLTGDEGSTAHDCTIEKTKDGAVFQTTAPLGPQETLTVVLAFPKGTFTRPPPPPAPAPRPAPSRSPWMWLELLLPPLLFGGLSFQRWRRHGKDPLAGPIVPRSEPPEGLSVAEADVILHGALGKAGISATLVDLAVRGYLRIHAEEDDRFELTRADFSELRPHEEALLDGLFLSRMVGASVRLDGLRARKLYDPIASIRRSVPEALVAKGYFQADPRRAGKVMKYLAVKVFAVGFFLALFATPWTGWLGAGLVVSAVLVFIFGLFMPQRTPQGAAVRDHLEGLRRHMALEGWEPAGSERPSRAAHFERLLPFALLFGMERQLVHLLGDAVYEKPPEWYVGGWQDPYRFLNGLDHTMTQASFSFTAPSSSGSSSSGFGGSGFGGGGFSGGGGGGGGGGGW